MRAAPGAEGPSDPMRFSHVSMTSFKFGNDATISIRPLWAHTIPNILTFYNSISNPERPSLLCAALPHSRHPASSIRSTSRGGRLSVDRPRHSTVPSKHTSRRERCALTAHSTGCTPLLLPAAALTASARIQSDPELLCAALPYPPRPEKSCI